LKDRGFIDRGGGRIIKKIIKTTKIILIAKEYQSNLKEKKSDNSRYEIFLKKMIKKKNMFNDEIP